MWQPRNEGCSDMLGRKNHPEKPSNSDTMWVTPNHSQSSNQPSERSLKKSDVEAESRESSSK